jgi:hypothetical protein
VLLLPLQLLNFTDDGYQHDALQGVLVKQQHSCEAAVRAMLDATGTANHVLPPTAKV